MYIIYKVVINMTIARKVKLLCGIKHIGIGELSIRLGHSKQNLYQKLNRNSFKVSDLEKIAEVLNCKVEIKFTSQDGEKII